MTRIRLDHNGTLVLSREALGSAPVRRELQPRHPAEAGYVCGDEPKLVSERARGDPEVIRTEQLSTTPEVSGQSTVGQSRFFVDGQEDVEISHHPQNRVISVLAGIVRIIISRLR